LGCVERNQPQRENTRRVRDRDNRSQVDRVSDGAARTRQIGGYNSFAVTRREGMGSPGEKCDSQRHGQKSDRRVLDHQQ
jgi:hypothetical protein